jgi:hypothetical protein
MARRLTIFACVTKRAFGIDWFELAPRQLDDLRDDLGVVPKRNGIGSPGPFDPGGMTASQRKGGHAAAERAHREYRSWGVSTG